MKLLMDSLFVKEALHERLQRLQCTAIFKRSDKILSIARFSLLVTINTFEQDYTFNSPSQAAGVMLGRNANGRVQWKTESGVTLKTQQEQNASEE